MEDFNRKAHIHWLAYYTTTDGLSGSRKRGLIVFTWSLAVVKLPNLEIHLIRSSVEKSFSEKSHLWCFRLANSQHLPKVSVHGIISFTFSLGRLNPTRQATSLKKKIIKAILNRERLSQGGLACLINNFMHLLAYPLKITLFLPMSQVWALQSKS